MQIKAFIQTSIGMLPILLCSCAMTSGVMDAGYGDYIVSAHASAVRGGATGANGIAYQDAVRFCAQHGAGLHPVVESATERDVYQTTIAGGWNKSGASLAGGSFASGNANLRFRCETTSSASADPGFFEIRRPATP